MFWSVNGRETEHKGRRRVGRGREKLFLLSIAQTRSAPFPIRRAMTKRHPRQPYNNIMTRRGGSSRLDREQYTSQLVHHRQKAQPFLCICRAHTGRPAVKACAVLVLFRPSAVHAGGSGFAGKKEPKPRKENTKTREEKRGHFFLGISRKGNELG